MDKHSFETLASTARRRFIRKSALTMTGAAALMTAPIKAAVKRSESKKYLMRFAVASDGHFGQPETPYKKFHQEMIGWLNEEADGKGLDFVVFNGDLIHDKPEFMPQVKSYFDQLTCPYFCTRGNHDQVTDLSWKNTWGYEVNHAVDKGEFGIILGNTANEKGEYLCADTEWMKNKLKSFASKKAIFVFLHISQRKWTSAAIDCPEVTQLLENTPNVAAVFHGHDHNMDNEIISNGLSYFFDSHIGGNWGTPYRGYRIVEVGLDYKVKTYQCNPQAFYVNSAAVQH